MVLGPDELDDEHWNKITKFISLKAEERNISDVNKMILLIKEFWVLLADTARLDAFTDEKRLDKLESHRNNLDAGRPDLDMEIADIRERLGR